MLINKDWLGRVFREEAGDDGGEGGGGEENNNENNDGGEENQAPEWLQSKYVAEGKTQEESIAEQAKAYTELSSKFGAFTGAPEEYAEVVLSDELKELGVEISADDPMLQAAKEFAKESNMSQEGLSGLVNLYAMQQVAEQKANEDYKTDQMKQLGNNAEARVTNIQQWASKNLDSETLAGLEGFATNAGAVKALEQIIKLTGAKSVDIDDSKGSPGIDEAEIKAMQFELDDNGQRRINTDKAFKAKYQKARNDFYGQEENRQMVG
jgi:hypothetical protein